MLILILSGAMTSATTSGRAVRSASRSSSLDGSLIRMIVIAAPAGRRNAAPDCSACKATRRSDASYLGVVLAVLSGKAGRNTDDLTPPRVMGPPEGAGLFAACEQAVDRGRYSGDSHTSSRST